MNSLPPASAVTETTAADPLATLKKSRGFLLFGAIVWLLLAVSSISKPRFDWFAVVLSLLLFAIYGAALKWVHPRILLFVSAWLILASLEPARDLVRGQGSAAYNGGCASFLIFFALVQIAQYRKLQACSQRA